MNIYIRIMEDLSLKNKYYYIWLSIIGNATKRASTRKEAKAKLGYVEGHHILPISFCLGGEKDAENIVYLTAKEHIMVHRLMCKFSKNEYRIKSLRAYHCMVWKNNGNRNLRKPSLHELSKAREAVSIANKGKRGMSCPDWFDISSDLEIVKERLQDLVNDCYSDPQIGKIYGVSPTCIYNWRKKLDIPNRRWQLRDEGWLYEYYINKKLSCQDIADIIGCTGATVQFRLKDFSIPIRNSYERQQNVDKEKRGFFPAKDMEGNKYFIKKDDPRYISGELVGWAKNIT